MNSSCLLMACTSPWQRKSPVRHPHDGLHACTLMGVTAHHGPYGAVLKNLEDVF
ncbi:hypothetical protein [Holospora elegans]|uniref:hypothetical protein n=1 Tax=Holospora elegans TaxID=431043 RepID=UPI00139F2B73|nr:hypothetical protein [Holospora elegans]